MGPEDASPSGFGARGRRSVSGPSRSRARRREPFPAGGSPLEELAEYFADVLIPRAFRLGLTASFCRLRLRSSRVAFFRRDGFPWIGRLFSSTHFVEPHLARRFDVVRVLLDDIAELPVRSVGIAGAAQDSRSVE